MPFPVTRKSDFPFLTDWFAISLRWLILLGITNSLIVADWMDWKVIGVVAFSAFWNGGVSVLAILNHRLPGHRLINVVIDFLTTGALFFLSGGLQGPLPGVGLLTIFSGAIYYGWPGCMGVALSLSLLQFVWAALFLDRLPALLPTTALLMLNLATAGIAGMLGKQLIVGLKQIYQGHVNKQLEQARQAQKAERTRLQTFYQMVETLSATLNYRVVLESALGLSIDALGGMESEAGKTLSAVLLFGEKGLEIGSARRLTPSDQKLVFPGQEGILNEVVQTAEPRLIETPTRDPEMGRILALQSAQSLLVLPLQRGLNAYGVMFYAHPDAKFFNAERCELLEMISHQVVIAIQNARLFQDLQEEKERIIESQEEARKKLARDLHDGPTQSVASIAMRINIAEKLMERSPQEALDELVKVEELARRTTQEIRTMLFTLRPLTLETEGLDAALHIMADQMRDTYQQNVLVEVNPEVVKNLEANKQTAVFFIVEEAVNNARKHAKAAEIRVSLRFLARDLDIAVLEIADNGVGFNVEEVYRSYERRGSLGMVNLNERADLINGVIHIDSAPGRGTKVQVAIPLTPDAADRLRQGKV